MTAGEFTRELKAIAAEGKLKALLYGPNADAGTPGTCGPILLAVGTAAPSDTLAGFAVGCAFYVLNQATGAVTAIYVNSGTAESCQFTLVSDTKLQSIDNIWYVFL